MCLGISASGQQKDGILIITLNYAEKINKKIKCKFYLAGGKNDLDL